MHTVMPTPNIVYKSVDEFNNPTATFLKIRMVKNNAKKYFNVYFVNVFIF